MKLLLYQNVRAMFIWILSLTLLLLPNLSVMATENAGSEIYNIIERNNRTELLSSNVYLSPNINTNGKKLIEVIIELRETPVIVEKVRIERMGSHFSSKAERTYERKIIDSYQRLEVGLKKEGINGKVIRTYKTVFSGVLLQLPAYQVPNLAKVEEIKSVHPVVKYEAIPTEVNQDMENSNPFLGIPQVHELGHKGEGVKVGILDTGIDYDHPDLKGSYKGGYDFVDNDNDPYEALPDDNDPNAATTHGTHVSGIIAGQQAQENGVLGVAPEVDLYMYRVLGPGGVGTTDWVISGIEKAIEDGMDVINLSLGSNMNDPDYPTSVAINNAMLAGTVAVVSSGNNGPNRWSVGSPGTSALAITVGASTIASELDIAYGTFSLNENKDYQLRLLGTDETTYSDTLNGDSELVFAGLGKPSDLEEVDVTGKIALMKRGEISFVNKIKNAKAKGAVAAIIFNDDQNNGFITLNLGQSEEFIPTFNMRGDDGREIIELIQNKETQNAEEYQAETVNNQETLQLVYEVQEDQNVDTVLVESSETTEDVNQDEQVIENEPIIETLIIFTFTSFVVEKIGEDELWEASARGPVKKTYDIKPDVIAPGVAIRSTIPGYGEDYSNAYQKMDGTSMASPHVAALAALLKEANPNFTAFDIKAILMNTAKLIGNSSVFEQGSGRVQPIQAINTPIIAQVIDQTTYLSNGRYTEIENITGSMNFGQVATGAETELTKTLKVKGLGDYSSNYSIRIEFLSNKPEGLELNVDQTEITVLEKEELDLVTTLTLDETVGSGEYQGYIYISNEEAEVHMPFVIFVGEMETTKGFGMIKALPIDFSPNADGVKDETTIEIQVNSAMNRQSILIWDPIAGIDNPEDGYIGQAFYWEGNHTLSPGTHQIDWDGSYFNFQTQEIEYLRDGYFSLEIFGWDNETPYVSPYSNWCDIYIDTKSPTITFEGDVEIKTSQYKTILNGNVKDLYVTLAQKAKISLEYEISHDEFGKHLGRTLEIDEAGEFQIPLINLPKGENVVSIKGSDEAGNTVEIKQSVWKEKESELEIESSVTSLRSEDTFEAIIKVRNVNHIQKAAVHIGYDSNVLELIEIKNNEDIGEEAKIEQDLFEGNEEDPMNWINMTVQAPITEEIALFSIDFKVKEGAQAQTTTLTLGEDTLLISDEEEEVMPWSLIHEELQIIARRPSGGGGGGFYIPPPSLEEEQKEEEASDGEMLVTNFKDFKEIQALPWAEPSIKRLVKLNIIEGDEKGEFRPSEQMTREQFAKVVVLAMGLEKNLEYNKTFSDVSSNRWSSGYIQIATQNYLIDGKVHDNQLIFSPETAITRAEIATILVRALKLKVDSVISTNQFNDIEDHWAKESIAIAYEEGLVRGRNTTSFVPNNYATRAEVSVLITRLLDYQSNIK